MTVSEIVGTVMTDMPCTELKVSLAIARELEGHDQVRLSISELMQLTGLAKQSVMDGLAFMLKRGIFDRTPEANSFVYFAKTVRDLDQNGTKTRPETVRDIDRSEKEGYENQTVSSRNLDRSEKPIHIPDFKDRKNERASVSSNEAFQTVARVVKSEVGFLSRRGFDFDEAVKLWNDALPDIWDFCLRAPNRKSDDLPIYRFEDACKRKFETGIAPKQRETSTNVAPPPEKPPFERYEQVLTPKGDVQTIVEVAPNGLVAFEETDELWFTHDLRPVQAVAA